MGALESHPLRRAARTFARDRDGAEVLLVVVKATFAIAPDGGDLRVADEQVSRRDRPSSMRGSPRARACSTMPTSFSCRGPRPTSSSSVTRIRSAGRARHRGRGRGRAWAAGRSAWSWSAIGAGSSGLSGLLAHGAPIRVSIPSRTSAPSAASTARSRSSTLRRNPVGVGYRPGRRATAPSVAPRRTSRIRATLAALSRSSAPADVLRSDRARMAGAAPARRHVTTSAGDASAAPSFRTTSTTPSGSPRPRISGRPPGRRGGRARRRQPARRPPLRPAAPPFSLPTRSGREDGSSMPRRFTPCSSSPTRMRGASSTERAPVPSRPIHTLTPHGRRGGRGDVTPLDPAGMARRRRRAHSARSIAPRLGRRRAGADRARRSASVPRRSLANGPCGSSRAGWLRRPRPARFAPRLRPGEERREGGARAAPPRRQSRRAPPRLRRRARAAPGPPDALDATIARDLGKSAPWRDRVDGVLTPSRRPRRGHPRARGGRRRPASRRRRPLPRRRRRQLPRAETHPVARRDPAPPHEPARRWGFTPGEAAASVCSRRRRGSSRSTSRLSGLPRGGRLRRRAGPARTKTVCVGTGLSAAFEGALAPPDRRGSGARPRSAISMASPIAPTSSASR